VKPADEVRDLTRLLAEDALPQSLVAGLRARGPDATELASLASRLALQGIDVTPPPSGGGPAPWKKWAAAGGGSVAIAVAWLALRAPVDAPKTPGVTAAPGAVAEQTPSPPGATAPSATGAVAPGQGARDAQPPSATAASPAAAAPAEVATAPEQPATERGSTPPAERALAEPSPAEGSRSVESSASASPSRSVDRAPSKRSGPGSTTSPIDSQPAGTPTEIELLRDARLALRQSPARALELAEQHARRYPGGKLTQEREVLAISALVALGRRTGALDRAARFDAAFPTSPYRKQVADLLR
jgi:hypothetical protein